VVVIGLPYPNIKNSIFSSRLKYIERKFGKIFCDSFVDDLCMRQVNQSVGLLNK
jgi:Rad3-related DNA helicase